MSCSLEFSKGRVIFDLTFVNTTRFKSEREIRTGSKKRTQQTLGTSEQETKPRDTFTEKGITII